MGSTKRLSSRNKRSKQETIGFVAVWSKKMVASRQPALSMGLVVFDQVVREKDVMRAKDSKF